MGARAYANTTPRPAAGDLFACPLEPDQPRGETSFRVIEVVAVTTDGLDVIVYGNDFATPPAEVDVRTLRRVRLHKMLGGPAPVPWAEFTEWRATPVRRVDVRAP